MKTFISLGAGVQSSTMALMAKHGEIVPMPDAAVFADTHNEPKEVYAWLDWLEKQLPFPVIRVSRGSLWETAVRVRISKKSGKHYTKACVPAFVKTPTGKGILRRVCTADFKIKVVYQTYNRLRSRQPVTQWIGISFDEAWRMKPSKRSWATNRFPLIDMRMTRTHCLEWMLRNGYPRPPRSACIFCPYHSKGEWKHLKDNFPDEFAQACEFEKQYQAALLQVDGFHGTAYLHESLRPLGEVDFSTAEDHGQGNLFINECEGMCGV